MARSRRRPRRGRGGHLFRDALLVDVLLIFGVLVDVVATGAAIGRIPHRCAISTAARLVAGCEKRVGRWRRGERQSPPRRDHLPEGLLRERSIAQLLRRDTYIIAGPGGHGIGVAADAVGTSAAAGKLLISVDSAHGGLAGWRQH